MARKRYALTVESKKQLIEFYDNNAGVLLDYLASYFSTIVGHKVGRTSISRILGDREKIMGDEIPQGEKNETTKIL